MTGKVEAVIPPVEQEAVHGVGAPRIDGAAADVLLIRRHVVGKARPDLFREIRNPLADQLRGDRRSRRFGIPESQNRIMNFPDNLFLCPVVERNAPLDFIAFQTDAQLHADFQSAPLFAFDGRIVKIQGVGVFPDFRMELLPVQDIADLR